MSKALFIYIIGMALGAIYIVVNRHSLATFEIITVCGLMICNYLGFMATLPKDTNMISSFVSDLPPSKL